MMNITQLQERVEKLEKSNRRMRWCGAVLVLVMISIFGFGAVKGERVLECEDLLIRDKQGNERIRMTMGDSGPYMRFYDSKLSPRAILQVQDDSSLFCLPGATKKSNVTLINAQEPAFYLTDNASKIRAELSTRADTVRLIMTNPDQKESMVLASASDGPSLSCFDDQQKLRAFLSVGAWRKLDNGTMEPGVSRLSLMDERQVQRTSMHAAHDSAAFAVADDNEIRRAALVYLKDKADSNKEGAVVATFDRIGDTIWVSPTTSSMRTRIDVGPRKGAFGVESPAAPATAPAK